MAPNTHLLTQCANEAGVVKHSPTVSLAMSQAALGIQIQTQTDGQKLQPALKSAPLPLYPPPTTACCLLRDKLPLVAHNHRQEKAQCLLALNLIKNISEKESPTFLTRRKTNCFQTSAGDLELLLASGWKKSRLHMVWLRAWIDFLRT